jgi:hypothetical protein
LAGGRALIPKKGLWVPHPCGFQGAVFRGIYTLKGDRPALDFLRTLYRQAARDDPRPLRNQGQQ